jgi:A/G-specific adenine glycosylase
MRYPSKREVSSLQRRLDAWFATNGRSFPWRKNRATLYQRIIPEVLLQRTRADVVAEFLPGFMKRYPSWSKLASSTEADLRQFLQPLGLWRRRASSLTRLAKAVSARNGRFPRARSAVESLPAIGQYICNAVMLFAYGQSEPLLDVNMARVLERCFGPRRLADIRYDSELQEIARLIVSGSRSVKTNWAILDLAAMVCARKTPRCAECPIKNHCDFYDQHRPNARTSS